MISGEKRPMVTRVYWTAFIGLFFDYYDYYLFVYLQRVLETQFALSVRQSNLLQFTAIAGVGVGALVFGYLADRFGRARMMLTVFGVYVVGIGALSLAWSYESLLAFRLIASLALGAEWGISHAFLSENVSGGGRYRFAALLQFSILGGLLAALASRYALPSVGWRWLFAASIVPVAILSMLRWRWLVGSRAEARTDAEKTETGINLFGALRRNGAAFLQCLAIASFTIASGTVNVFLTKDLPQSPFYTTLFWAILAPSMLMGSVIVRRFGVRQALLGYAVSLVVLSGFAWSSAWSGRKLAFALMLPVLNGIPFGLMGAYFNEVFSEYRTLFSGAAYNLGRICAGLSPVLITALGLQTGGNYFLFTAALGICVAGVGLSIAQKRHASPGLAESGSAQRS